MIFAGRVPLLGCTGLPTSWSPPTVILWCIRISIRLLRAMLLILLAPVVGSVLIEGILLGEWHSRWWPHGCPTTLVVRCHRVLKSPHVRLPREVVVLSSAFSPLPAVSPFPLVSVVVLLELLQLHVRRAHL